MTNVLLVSANKKLERLCRELLQSKPVHFNCETVLKEDVPADVCIHDLGTAAEAPRTLERADESRHGFLVDAAEVAELHRRLAPATPAVLVKPAKRPALAEWLEYLLAGRGLESGGDERRAERDALLQCVLLASVRLQQHSLEQTNFLARALHDFRAPLTAAVGYCSLLMEQATGPLNREQLEILSRTRHSLERLSGLAASMFLLSTGRIENAVSRFEPRDISACIEQAVFELTPVAEQRGIEMSMRVERPAESLCFNAGQVEQVLINLLENACKFTPAGGSITVTGGPVSWPLRNFRIAGPDRETYRPVEEQPNAYRVDISDSGPGVPAALIGRIFEQSLSYSGSQDRSGTGLGLATCRMILAAHQGEIFVDSREQGATFSFVLPFIRREARDEARVSAGSPCVAGVSR